MVSALNSSTQQLVAQNYAGRAAVETDAGKSNSAQKQAVTGNGTVTDTVDISGEAQKLLQSQAAQNPVVAAKSKYYEQFMPARDGFSSANLTVNITDPSAQPFSQNRSFDEVAAAARESMDGKYQQMKESGKPFDINSWHGKDAYALMGDLDRRALYAIASNEGGQFSTDEIGIAKMIMGQQQGWAMGNGGGPTSVLERVGVPIPTTNAELAQWYKNGMNFLDQVSAEEKASFDWAVQRAGTQFGYENVTGTKGTSGYDSDSPLVKLIKEALDNAWRYEGENSNVGGSLQDPENLKAQPWFENYADRLDSAIAEHRKLYSVAA